jgi:RND family efflux transporter MFP subunit
MVATSPSPAPAESPSDRLARLRIPRDEELRPRRSRGRRLIKLAIWLVLLLIVAGVGGVLAIKNDWVAGADKWLQVPEVIQPRVEVREATVTVEKGRSADATVKATGYLKSRRQAKIGARAPGRIEVVNVEEGSLVKQNEVLAVLEHADLEASLAATRATHARALAEQKEQDVLIQQTKRDFDRAEALRESRGFSDAEYDTAKFAYEGAVARRASLDAAAALAAARVAEAEQMKENMFIRAPFAGTVISKDAEVGESIMPGGMGEASGRGSVVTVADLAHLEVDCDVKEDLIYRVQPGQSAEVAVDAVPDRRYQGRVRKIIPMGDRARATIKVMVEVVDADEKLFPEMGANVYFLPPTAGPAAEVSQEPRVFCNSDAIRKDKKGTYVLAVNEEERLVRIDVKVGAENDGRTEIEKNDDGSPGLSESDRVVIAPKSARPGQLVNFE